MIAAVNLGGDVGAFRGDPPFNFSAAARNSQQLLRPVAEVYQRFLGAKNVQTGSLSPTFTVQMDEFVKDAYLVVAADGPLGLLQQSGRNPGAADIDLNYRGGGETFGLDGGRRGYRIVRFKNPNAGPWTFNVSVGGGGGWMLIQDRSVGLRLVSRTAPSGMATSLEVEAYDERTGESIRDPSKLPGMSVELEIDGRRVKLSDDGASGDRAPGDGIYSASVIFTGPGSKRLTGRLRTGDIDRQVDLTVDVAEAGVSLVPSTPESVLVGQEVAIQAWLQSDAPGGSPRRYPLIQARTSNGETLELRDDGRGADATAGDGRYSAAWIAGTVGKVRMSFTLPGDSDPPVESVIMVEEPPPPPTMTSPDPVVPSDAPPREAPVTPPPPPPPPLTPAAADFSFGTPSPVRIGPVGGEGARPRAST
jgi:hypothetical protein